jgi:thiosulfate dehydrogenase [quinone] large subunit
MDAKEEPQIQENKPLPGGALAWAMAALRVAIGWHFLYEGMWKLMQEDGWSCLSYLSAAQGPLAPAFKWMAGQAWIVVTGDWAVQLGLVAIGLSLMSGVLARVAALFGIALMAMFYCCQPPVPFAEAVSGADGRFFIIERNVVEALGLAFIAVQPCWRGFLRTLLPGALALAVFGGVFWMHYRAGGLKKVQAVTSATVKVHEFTALAALKAPFAEKAEIGGVKISRLALDGDLIAGHAHARDLIWADEFMRRYNGGVTLGRTVRYCLHCGIDAVFGEPQFLAKMSAEAKAASGELKYFVSCADAKDAALALSGGAKGVYLRPDAADALAKKGDAAALKELFAAVKAVKLPAGVGAEDVATVKFCAENGILPDFWVLAFHSLEYPAARMTTRCNNIWCVDPVAAAEYMKTRPEPWVAVRGRAGGAISAKAAYDFAVKNGAAAVALDLLDYNIVDAVNAIAVAPKAAADGKAKKEAGK